MAPLQVRPITTVSFQRPGDDKVEASGPGMTSPLPKASEVRSWRYQLQNIKPSEIARMSDDLIVVDYAGDNGPFSPAQVERMRRKPDGSRRLVIAYLSIGEAENYRFYWNRAWLQQPPEWLGKENPSWHGNYAVRFWDPSWQDIVFDYAGRIVAAGFDGVYLDKIDSFRPARGDDRFRCRDLRADEGQTAGLCRGVPER